MGKLIDVDDLRIALGMGVLCGNKTAIQLINEAPIVEAIPKAEYETRLKADMVAMLTELQLEFEEIETGGDTWELAIKDDCINLIQQKINALKGDQEGEE